MFRDSVRALVILALVPFVLAATCGPPEKPAMSEQELLKTASHVIVGEVRRVYTADEKEPGFRYRRSIAEIHVESVEKAPGPGGSGRVIDVDRALEGTLIYARWFHRSDTRNPPLPGGSGHHGWSPARGDRVRAYLARNAYDGFARAEDNADGGYNVVVPNGFEKLERAARSR